MAEQLEFKFFWPLTEQIPLDLDYSNCSHRTTVTITGPSPLFVNSGSIQTATITAKGITLDAGTITVKSIEMPWYRKLLFKLIGFKYE